MAWMTLAQAIKELGPGSAKTLRSHGLASGGSYMTNDGRRLVWVDVERRDSVRDKVPDDA